MLYLYDELSSVLINILDLKFLQKHKIGKKTSSKFNLHIVWLQTFIAFFEQYFDIYHSLLVKIHIVLLWQGSF